MAQPVMIPARTSGMVHSRVFFNMLISFGLGVWGESGVGGWVEVGSGVRIREGLFLLEGFLRGLKRLTLTLGLR